MPVQQPSADTLLTTIDSCIKNGQRLLDERINPSIPNLFMKKPGLVRVGLIISASPPCLSLWIDQPLSGERSCVESTPR